MTAGFTKPSTTNSSATLEIQGVEDIGLNSFLITKHTWQKSEASCALGFLPRFCAGFAPVSLAHFRSFKAFLLFFDEHCED